MLPGRCDPRGLLRKRLAAKSAPAELIPMLRRRGGDRRRAVKNGDLPTAGPIPCAVC
jgi:hypothetical protein